MAVDSNLEIGGNITATTFYGDGSNLTGIVSGSAFSTSTTRSVFSSSATGLTYNNSTGDFSLTSGYSIPLTASTTEWASKISSQWSTSGSNIYYNSVGNVGIGLSNPTVKLDVISTDGNKVRIGYSSTDSSSAPTSIADSYYLRLGGMEYGANSYRLLGFGYSDMAISGMQAPAYIGYQEISNSGYTNGDLIFGTRSTLGATDVASERMRINHLGNVGIGTTTPSKKLSVSGDSMFDGDVTVSSITSGSLLFAGAAGLISENNASLFWDIDNYRLGVGSAGFTAYLGDSLGFGVGSGYMSLDLQSAAGSGTGTIIADSTGGDPTLYFNNANTDSAIEFYNNDAQRIIARMSAGAFSIYSPSFALTNFNASVSDTGLVTFDTAGDAPAFNFSDNVSFSGNVGIGTTTPTARLAITGTGAGTGKAFVTANSSNVEKFTILDNGNVGIGVSNPTKLFEVASSSIDVGGNLILAGSNPLVSSGSGSLMLGGYGLAARSPGLALGSATGIAWSDTTIAYNAITTDIGISRISVGTLGVGNSTVGDYSGTLVAGSIGISTTTPGYALTVAGDISLTGALRANGDAGTAGMVLLSQGSSVPTWVATSSLGISGGGSSPWTTLGSDIYYDTGAVAIGQTTIGATYKLEVAGKASTTQLYIPNTSSATVGGIYFNATRFIHNYGNRNQFMGVTSGNLTLTGSDNTGIGEGSLVSLTSGLYNAGVGNNSLHNISSGQRNSAVGYNALYSGSGTGYDNAAFGHGSLFQGTASTYNTGIGSYSLYGITNGTANTSLGYNAGRSLSTGSYNIAIGQNVQVPSNTGSQQLNIGNLIYGTGVYGTNSLSSTPVTGGYIGIGTSTPGYTLTVAGDISLTGALRIPNTTSSTVGGIFFGANRMIHNYGTQNFFAGEGAGNITTTATQNTAVGATSMVSLTELATRNTALGYYSANGITTGQYNTFVGSFAGYQLTTAAYNTGIGYGALSGIVTNGDYNIGLGYYAGDNITSGDRNITIGYLVDAPSGTANNQLNIGNLIYGINVDGTGSTISTGNIGIATTTPDQKLTVNGNIKAASSTTNVGVYLNYTGASGREYALLSCYNCGSAGLGGLEVYDTTASASRAYIQAGVNGWQTPSDRRLKDNIETLSVLDRIDSVRGTSYTLKDSGILQIGVIAQEIKAAFPEAVSGEEIDGRYLGVSYNAIASIALQGVRELNTLYKNILSKIEYIALWFGDSGDRFTVQGMVCVDDVCVTKDQFKQILLNSGTGFVSTVSSSPSSTSDTTTSTSTSSTSTTTSPESSTDEGNTNVIDTSEVTQVDNSETTESSSVESVETETTTPETSTTESTTNDSTSSIVPEPVTVPETTPVVESAPPSVETASSEAI